MKTVEGRYAEIANRLRLLREHYNLPSKNFAEQAQVSAKSYSQWESGDFRISLDGALAICARFGVTLDFIYLGRIDTLPYSLALRLTDVKADVKKTLVHAG
ncbi:helix-turn-helix transcriptional regulator [Tritonibacter litoralis]|nr:helix-turn-helix transcriptional regulator [Tritonibacter litoralis]